MQEIMRPTIKALAKEGAPYSGVLYGGLMITAQGPKTSSSTAAGEPRDAGHHAQTRNRPGRHRLSVIEKRLDRQKIDWSPKACVGVVMASGGYPDHYETGFPINGWRYGQGHHRIPRRDEAG